MPGESLHQRWELSLYHVETAPYTRLAIHGQKRAEWVVSHVLQGEVQTAAGGERHRAVPGDVMVHPPGVPFDETAETAGVHQWMGFTLGSAPPFDLLRQYPVSPVVRLTDSHRYEQDFATLERHWNAPAAPTRELQIFALTLELLAQVITGWQAAGSVPRPAAMNTPQDRFFAIVAYMETHLSEPLSRETLAGLACLHPGYFDRAFRAAYGVPPMQMLREFRLRQARRLLETTDDTLPVIAEKCGLGDAPHFSRVFRAQFGVPPGQYRQNTRQSRLYIP